jgi:hypothetical protein
LLVEIQDLLAELRFLSTDFMFGIYRKRCSVVAQFTAACAALRGFDKKSPVNKC